MLFLITVYKVYDVYTGTHYKTIETAGLCPTNYSNCMSISNDSLLRNEFPEATERWLRYACGMLITKTHYLNNQKLIVLRGLCAYRSLCSPWRRRDKTEACFMLACLLL